MSKFAICDGTNYFQRDAVSIQEVIKYFLNVKPHQRIKINLEEIINDILYNMEYKNMHYNYFSSKNKCWTQYSLINQKYLRIVIPVSEHEIEQTFDLGER